ncbi:adenylate/guanylate cyclase domain-containing protein [Pseudoduganella rivuli]|nr:adenylate/guanylate cyclase domain-containing protein [Pseudoduganella rivuli]
MKLLRTLWLAWLLCTACCASAQSIVPAIVPDIALLEDPQGTLALADAIAAGNRFAPGSPSVGFTTSAYWMRFTVRNPGGEAMTWWFDTGNRTLQEVDVYQPDGRGGWLRMATGSRYPFAQRPLPTDTFVFPLTVAAGASTDVYLRVRSTGFLGVSLLPRLWTPSAYLQAAQADRRAWLTYLGMTASLGAFNLMLWVYLRERNYLLYVLTLASIVWAISSTAGGFGSAFQLFWPNSPGFEQCSWMLSQIPVTWLPVLFAFQLVDLHARTPRLSRAIWGVITALTVAMVAMVVLTVLQRPSLAPLLQGLYVMGWFLWLPVYPLVAFAVGREAWRGDRMARYFCLAYIPSIVVAAAISTQALRGLPPALSNMLWASAFELLVMALALADYLNSEHQEKIGAQEALLDSTRRNEQDLERKVLQRTLELNAEQKRTKELLYNILPVELADELSATGQARPARHESATVLFTDFAGFTAVASTMPADRMVAELNEIFAAFDDITDECGVEKIKTIGDAYMAAAGLPKPCVDHAQRCVRAGLKMIAYIEQRNRRHPFKWTLRVGIHSGPVVAGVVGKRKYAFDIWGDTVNIASRMESSGEGMRVNVSAYTSDLAGGEFDCEYRGKVAAKGKGEIDMYFVRGARNAAVTMDG